MLVLKLYFEVSLLIIVLLTRYHSPQTCSPKAVTIMKFVHRLSSQCFHAEGMPQWWGDSQRTLNRDTWTETIQSPVWHSRASEWPRKRQSHTNVWFCSSSLVEYHWKTVFVEKWNKYASPCIHFLNPHIYK
jgi:hypothetical protein